MEFYMSTKTYMADEIEEVTLYKMNDSDLKNALKTVRDKVAELVKQAKVIHPTPCLNKVQSCQINNLSS